MKKAITQEHSMGCAVACTAYVLNRTYKQALKLYNNPQNAWGRGFYCREIVRAMLGAGKQYGYRILKSKLDKTLDIPGTIVFIPKSEAYPAGHFLARTPHATWMNPWIKYPSIAPAKSGFQTKLPTNPLYVVFPKENIICNKEGQ